MGTLKKNLAYNFLLSCSQVLLPLVTIPYLTRVLLPDGIGRVSFVDSLSYYFVTIAEFGIVVYGIREVARVKHEKEKLRQLVSELLVLHCITSAVALVAYCISVYLLFQKIQDMRLVWFSISFLLANFFACEWYFWGTEKFKYITIRSLISRGLGVVSILVLIRQPQHYYIYYGIMVAAAVVNLLSNAIVLFSQVKPRLQGVQWRRHLRYTTITWLISLFYSIPLMLDNVLLGLVSSAAAVGIYAFSIKIVRLSSNVLTDLFLVLYPRTVSMIRENKTAELQQMILKSVQLIILLSVPICAGVFLLSGPLVRIFMGKNFYAVDTNLKILALFPFARAYGLFLSKQILVSYDRERLYLKSLITGSLLFVAFTLVLSGYLNDKGACYAITVTEVIITAMNFYYVKQTAPGLQIFDWLVMGQAVAGCLLFIPVIFIVSKYLQSDWAVLMASAAICVPLYFSFQVIVCRNRILYSVYSNALQKIRK